MVFLYRCDVILRQLKHYDDKLSCIDSLWLRQALAEFTGKQITSKSWGIYRRKAGLISDMIGVDGKVIPTKQRTVTAREAVMVMGFVVGIKRFVGR